MGCCNLIIYVIGRLTNTSDKTIYWASFSMTTYIFKVILAQGTIRWYYLKPSYWKQFTYRQGTRYKRITLSIGIIAFTWSLIAIVIVNAYYSAIISNLSANYKKPEVSNLEELANNKAYNMLVIKGTAIELHISVSLCTKYVCIKCIYYYTITSQTAVSKSLQVLAKKYKQCSECSAEFNANVFAKKIIEGNYVAALVNKSQLIFFL